jgi:hypothetical protein
MLNRHREQALLLQGLVYTFQIAGKKKGQPKLPKMPCVLIASRKTYGFFRLCESFQIKNPNPAKNRTMRLTVSTPAITTLSKNMTRLLHLLGCDGAKLTKRAGANIDRDQCCPRPGLKAGGN